MSRLQILVEDTRTSVEQSSQFSSSPVRIGRNALNDLLLDEPSVSQWHGVIHFDSDDVTFVDVGSTNGSKVNGRQVPVHERVAIGEQDDLRIGPLRLRALRNRRSHKTVAFAPMELDPDSSGSLENGSLPDADLRTKQASAAMVQLAQLNVLVSAIAPQRDAYFQVLEEQLRAIPLVVRRKVVPQLMLRYPELRFNPWFSDLVRELGVGELDDAVSVAKWLEDLVGHPVCADASGRPVEDRVALNRIQQVLVSFSEAYLELRKAYDHVGKEFGIDTGLKAPLDAPKTAKDLLAYLFDFHTDGEARSDELRRAYAEIAIHQIAMLSGLVEGVRAMLQDLEPEKIASQALSSRRGLRWFKRSRVCWQAFSEHFQRLMEHDRFTRSLFGSDFIRAYYAVTGRGSIVDSDEIADHGGLSKKGGQP